MRKTQIHIIVLFFLAISCRTVEREQSKKEPLLIAQKSEQKKTTENAQSISNNAITARVSEEQTVKENLNKLKIKFSKIDSTDYFEFKHKYFNGIEMDATIVNEAGSTFSLRVKNTDKKFSCDIDYTNCTYYKGFLSPLNKYILTACGSGYCGTYLLDKSTGIQNYLESPFDSECEIPSLSKDENKLIAYSYSVFDRKSFIALYKKNSATKKIDFKTYDSFYTSDWRIKEIIWIDNNFIALKVFDEYGGKTGSELINARYLKGKIE